MFELAPDADVVGTYHVGEFEAAPCRLVEVFGPPSEADGYKISGEYLFRNKAAEVFTLYDWKTTSLFDDYDEGDESPFPSPEDFWRESEPYLFQIGGRDGTDVEAFKRWLSDKIT